MTEDKLVNQNAELGKGLLATAENRVERKRSNAIIEEIEKWKEGQKHWQEKQNFAITVCRIYIDLFQAIADGDFEIKNGKIHFRIEALNDFVKSYPRSDF